MNEKPIQFPATINDSEESDNPAILLFGNRLISEQSPLELLVELLLVASSPKKLGNSEEITEFFPTAEQIRNWVEQQVGGPLLYAPKTRLCLKLFSFLGSSRIETRHFSHQTKYRELLRKLENKIESSEFDKTDILQSVENLFIGFLGAGLNRTWCAQTFLPMAKGMLCAETLWNETIARAKGDIAWPDLIMRLNTFFSVSKHRFLARGGEVLYLQICNALAKEKFSELNKQYALGLNSDEIDSEVLRRNLISGFRRVIESCPAGIGELAEWIDQADGFTAHHTDRVRGEQRFAKAGWCPVESWPEASLFAIEVSRLCSAAIDPIERIELLTLACVFHVLRNLCAQSIRYTDDPSERKKLGSMTGYAWISGPIRTDERVIKDLSHRCLVRVQDMIRTSLRSESIRFYASENKYKEADRRYGHKLFLSLSKKIGFVIPQRGPGARFILSDRILRFLVMVLVRPGERCTLDTFKKRLYAHFGIAVDGEEVSMACQWADVPVLTDHRHSVGKWFETMLRQAGFLIELSDAISLVQNPFQSLLSGKG